MKDFRKTMQMKSSTHSISQSVSRFNNFTKIILLLFYTETVFNVRDVLMALQT
jgi:hypothetical protein